MLVLYDSEQIDPEWTESIVCMGTFDGIHLGHQKLIKQSVLKAQAEEIPSVVLTFDRHPLYFINPEKAPKAIVSLEENLDRMKMLGVSLVVVLKFDNKLSEESADSFFSRVIQNTLKAKEIFLGKDHAFGKNREGNIEWLKQRIPTNMVDYVDMDGFRISSTQIRTCISEGDLELVKKMLGRWFSLSGIVVSGQKLGRKLGFPTINIARPVDFILPKLGIYAGWCQTEYGLFKAAVSIGVRPTVNGKHRVIEAFLIDYPGDSLYGKPVRLELTKRIRDEKKFESLDHLVSQMKKDVEIISKI